MSGKTPVIYTVYAVIAYMYLFTVNIILITESREVRDVFIHVNTIFITEPREFRVRGNASDLLQSGLGGTGLRNAGRTEGECHQRVQGIALQGGKIK